MRSGRKRGRGGSNQILSAQDVKARAHDTATRRDMGKRLTDRSHLGLSERIDGRLRVCEQCPEEALFLHIKRGRDRDGAEVGLAALQLARDDGAPMLPDGRVVREEVRELLFDVGGAELLHDEHRGGGARAEAVALHRRRLEEVLEDEAAPGGVLLARDVRVVDPGDRDGEQEAELPERGPEGDEQELDDALRRQERAAGRERVVRALAAEAEGEIPAGDGGDGGLRSLEDDHFAPGLEVPVSGGGTGSGHGAGEREVAGLEDVRGHAAARHPEDDHGHAHPVADDTTARRGSGAGKHGDEDRGGDLGGEVFFAIGSLGELNNCNGQGSGATTRHGRDRKGARIFEDLLSNGACSRDNCARKRRDVLRAS